MKSQFIFAFAALFMIASLITEGDCITNLHPAGKVRKVIYWNENILIRLGQLFPTDLLKKKRTKKAYRISLFRFSKTHFQNEDMCKTFPVKIRFICMRIIFILFKVIRPSYFVRVPSYFEALWYPHLYFDHKSNI